MTWTIEGQEPWYVEHPTSTSVTSVGIAKDGVIKAVAVSTTREDAGDYIVAALNAHETKSPAYQVGWQPMSSAPRDGTHVLALLYREATSDMDDRRWPAFSEIREIFYKPYLAFGMQLPWHAGDPFEEPSGIGSEHMGEGVPIAWQALTSVDICAALASAEVDG